MQEHRKPTIFVRRRENWRSFRPLRPTWITHQVSWSGCAYTNIGDHDGALRNLRWWEENMHVPFPTYRAQIADVAEESWCATGMSTQYERHAGDAHWVVPTDDDDLYHPDLLNYISEAIDTHEPRLVHWDCWCYMPCTAHCFYSGRAFYRSPLLGSNAYAVNAAEDADVIYNHCDATRLFMSGVKVTSIDKALSIWVRHPASFVLIV